MQALHGSAHPGAMNCLFADGSVVAVSYGASSTVAVQLWSYKDATVITGEYTDF